MHTTFVLLSLLPRPQVVLCPYSISSRVHHIMAVTGIDVTTSPAANRRVVRVRPTPAGAGRDDAASTCWSRGVASRHAAPQWPPSVKNISMGWDGGGWRLPTRWSEGSTPDKFWSLSCILCVLDKKIFFSTMNRNKSRLFTMILVYFSPVPKNDC